MIPRFEVNKYFDFLKSQKGFKGPYYYMTDNILFWDYVKKDIAIHITYQGKFRVYIYKIKNKIDNFENGRIKVNEITHNDIIKCFHLSKLDIKNKIWNSVSNENFPDKELWYYSKLIKLNPEILENNFKKFSFWNTILVRIRF